MSQDENQVEIKAKDRRKNFWINVIWGYILSRILLIIFFTTVPVSISVAAWIIFYLIVEAYRKKYKHPSTVRDLLFSLAAFGITNIVISMFV